MRRWARRIGLAILALVVAVTLAAIGFDLATAGESRSAKALYSGPYVQVGKTLVAYRKWGNTGTPIVLLGGAAEPSWVWHRVGPLLAADHHEVYAVDLPPFGYTQRRGPYTLAGWVALLRGFEHRLGIRRPLVVGHSLGAAVAVGDALDDPAEVGGIVLLDGDALPFGHGHSLIPHLLVYPYFTALYRILTQSDWLVAKLVRNAWGPSPPKLGHVLLAQFERPFRVAGTADALKQLVGGGIPGVSLTDLARVRVPRAVIWGVHDNVDSIASGKTTAAALGTKLVRIPHAGHLSMLANPKATAAAIDRAAARARR